MVDWVITFQWQRKIWMTGALAETQADSKRLTPTWPVWAAVFGLVRFSVAGLLSAILNVTALGLLVRWIGMSAQAPLVVMMGGQFVLNLFVAAWCGQRRQRAVAIGALVAYMILPALIFFVWIAAFASGD